MATGLLPTDGGLQGVIEGGLQGIIEGGFHGVIDGGFHGGWFSWRNICLANAIPFQTLRQEEDVLVTESKLTRSTFLGLIA